MKTKVGLFIGNGPNCSAPLQCQRYLLHALNRHDTEFHFKAHSWGDPSGFDLLHVHQIPVRISELVRSMRAGKIVSHVHGDLIYSFPHLSVHGGLKRRWITYNQKVAMKRISHFMPVSNYLRRSMNRFLGIPSDQCQVVYNGIDDRFFSEIDEDGLPEFDKPFILHVSAYAPKKNVGALLEAFRGLQGEIDHDLFIVGGGHRNGPTSEMVNHLGIDGTVKITGRVTDRELIWLYRHADMMIFPSLHETFGLPIIEAMASGCPVITSNRTSLPEIGGEAPVYVDPLVPGDLRKAILKVHEDPGLQGKMVSKGYERSELFTWSKAAESVLHVYRKVMNE